MKNVALLITCSINLTSCQAQKKKQKKKDEEERGEGMGKKIEWKILLIHIISHICAI